MATSHDAAGVRVGFDSLVQDVRYALRTLRRAPLFAATVAATMGLGLGLLGSAFTLLNAYVLKPIDLPDPYALYSLSWSAGTAQSRQFSLDEYEALTRESPDFSGLAAAQSVTVIEDDLSTVGLLVTGNYFELLGARPALGRLLRPDDAVGRGGTAVVVLSHQAWRSRYGSNPAIIGQQIPLGRQHFEVVGVAAPHAYLSGQELVSFWAPLTMAGAFPAVDPWSDPNAALLAVVGRLQPGATDAAVRAWFDVWRGQRAPSSLDADAVPVAVRLDSLATRIRLDGVTLNLFVLIMSAFGLVLLVACANVTNVMLARALARQPEITMRLALGASRWRIARQLIVESLVLAVPAAAAGLVIVIGVARLFPAAILATFPVGLLPVENLLVPIDPDLRVMAFLGAAAVAGAVLITLAPIGRLARLRLTQASRGEAASDVRGSRLRSGLVAMQIGASGLFLAGAIGLIDESSRLSNPQPNLSYERVALVSVDPVVRGRIAARLASDPAVEQIAVTSKPPMVAGALPVTRVAASTTNVAQTAGYMIVSPEYFPLFGIEIVRGRTFTPAEAAGREGVALVSRATAAALWPGLDPIGQTLELSDVPQRDADPRLPRGRVRIVGVTDDVASGSILEGIDATCVYFPAGVQEPDLSLLVRGRVDNTDVLRPAVAAAVGELAPDTPFQVMPMRTLASGAAWIFQAFSAAASVLGVVGLLFAYSGTHAVVSFLVARRRREFGVRMALGASGWRIVVGMLSETSRIAAVGLAAGLALAAGMIRLFGASIALLPDYGPRPFVLAAAMVFMATITAALWPLRDTARMDPVEALRAE